MSLRLENLIRRANLVKAGLDDKCPQYSLLPSSVVHFRQNFLEWNWGTISKLSSASPSISSDFSLLAPAHPHPGTSATASSIPRHSCCSSDRRLWGSFSQIFSAYLCFNDSPKNSKILKIIMNERLRTLQSAGCTGCIHVQALYALAAGGDL
ncbi:hypothetical protein BT96DRAFT_402289 [Gymnopus androsaceus JB14]|uniref:Uncharacterized protein n=1 Tax=Gymnopus androsaceus JB14 TaxID=1447944 RepID=A0A6A4GWC0_9AGAR|nr:hypothetical protein BT96DRAFT_402289 [Gymnopus androsaceus JB14]